MAAAAGLDEALDEAPDALAATALDELVAELLADADAPPRKTVSFCRRCATRLEGPGASNSLAAANSFSA